MKYKVGDKVKLREDLIIGMKYGNEIFTEARARYRGIISIIDYCYPEDNTYEIKESLLPFSEEMIEGLVEDGNEIKKTKKKGISMKFEIKYNIREHIKDYVIIVPNKVVEVLFEDGTTEKMVCQEEDTFDIRRCLFIALAKHLYKKEYTFEGIEYKANEMMYIKQYTKMIDHVIKNHVKGELAVQKKKQQEQEEKERIDERRNKRYEYKERCKQKEKERQIELQKEAYLRAMREYDAEKAEKEEKEKETKEQEEKEANN